MAKTPHEQQETRATLLRAAADRYRDARKSPVSVLASLYPGGEAGERIEISSRACSRLTSVVRPSERRRIFPVPRIRYAKSQVFMPLGATRTASPLQR